jgi:hypothetical protein
MALDPIRNKPRLQTQAPAQQVVRPQFCALSVKLLFNRLAGNYFNSPAGLNLATGLDRFFSRLSASLSQSANQIDQMDRARNKISDFLTEKGKNHSIPANLNAENPTLIEDFLKQETNGEYDLGQLCGELSWAMTGIINEKTVRHFKNVYYVLRAGQLLAGPASVPNIANPNPVTPANISRAEMDSDYTKLDWETEGKSLKDLFRFAMTNIPKWKESLQSIVFKTQFPREIREAIRAAITDVKDTLEISKADNRFFEGVRVDARNKQENEAKEILQRTLGEVRSMLDPWIKREKETTPDLNKLTSSLRLALIYYKFIIEPTE